jgi:hypothetical protein
MVRFHLCWLVDRDTATLSHGSTLPCFLMSCTDVHILSSTIPGWRYLSGDSVAATISATQQTVSFASRSLSNLVFDTVSHSLFLMNGYAGSAASSAQDAYRSDDQGATWTQVNAANAYGQRYAAGAASRQVGSTSHLIVCGGIDSSGTTMTDCWSSSNDIQPLGQQWTREVEIAPFGPRSHHSLLTVGQSVILFAGLDGVGAQKNDGQSAAEYAATAIRTFMMMTHARSFVLLAYVVWLSIDGSSSWTSLGLAAFSPRHRHGAAVQLTVQSQANAAQQNLAAPTCVLMVAGGWSQSASSALNDVYSSIDGGVSWSLVTSTAQWAARQGHQLVGGGGAWFVIGGQIGAFVSMATQDGHFDT